MRATKLIKDYVTKKVYEAYPKTAEELAWEELKNKLGNAREKADEIIKEYAEKVIAELNIKNGFENDYCLEVEKHYSLVTFGSCFNSEIYNAYCKAREQRIKKIDETIEEILINLELGGTRKDLDEMLANIGK
jgi:hypothetical protein